MSGASSTALRIATLRRTRRRRDVRALAALAGAALLGFLVTLALGQSLTPPLDVLRVLAGEDVPGASFLVADLRLPRALLSILTGMSFGLAGAACQTMLRNPLASPDIIGITAGSAAAAVAGIALFSLSGAAVAALAVAAGLGTALVIYLLAWRDGVSGTRLILVGIGISAMLDSVTAYVLAKAPAWSLHEALRWLTGSVNGAQLSHSLPVLMSLLVFGGLILSLSRDLEALRLGDDKAAALGVRPERVRLLLILAIVGLIAFATSAAGPIAFVAFLSGPIAGRLVGAGRPVLAPAALVGAGLVLLGDYAGQFLLPSRYPVGVVTGILGAPYLIHLILRANRNGGAL